MLSCVSQLGSFIHEWQEVSNDAECGPSLQWKTHFFQPTYTPDKHQIETTTKVNQESGLSFVGTRETMACVVVIMKQRLPFQQLPFYCGSSIMLLYIFYEFIWFEREWSQNRLCSLIWCTRPSYCMYTVCVSERMCISNMIHLWWIKPAVSIEQWPRTPCTRGNRWCTRPLSAELPNIAWSSTGQCFPLRWLLIRTACPIME